MQTAHLLTPASTTFGLRFLSGGAACVGFGLSFLGGGATTTCVAFRLRFLSGGATCTTFRATSTALHCCFTSAHGRGCSCNKPGNAQPCKDLFEFLFVHHTPPFGLRNIYFPNPAIRIVIASEVARRSRSKPERDSSLRSEQAPQSRLF